MTKTVDVPTWQQVQNAWSKGNITAARSLLSDLINTGGDVGTAQWGLWGDTAVALDDFQLAAQAYQNASARQPNHPYVGRYLYAQLQTTKDLAEFERAYAGRLRPAGEPEDKLLSLVLEIELHYRRGDIPAAAQAGSDLFKQWPTAQNSDSLGFLEYIAGRIWLTLARIAEAAGNIPVASQFLDRLAVIEPKDPLTHSIVALLSTLLARDLPTGNRTAEDQIAARLHTLLASDFSTVEPVIPQLLLASLQKTQAALAQTGLDRLALLAEAIKLRPTNMLARRMQVAELVQQGKNVGSLLANEVNLWLALNQPAYRRHLSHYLSRTSPAQPWTEFSFVALGGGSTVGGSAYLFNLNGTKLLLDVGIDVTTSPAATYRRLKHALGQSGVVNSLADLNAVIISHAHLDHVGLLPLLYNDPDLPRVKTSMGLRPRLNFYGSSPTREIARIMLEDASRIAQSNHEPLYTVDQVIEALNELKPLPKNGLLSQFYEWGRATFFESGHILGAKMVLLEKDGLRVLHTGDLNTRAQFSLPASHSLKDLQPDVLVIESTYGYGENEWIVPRDWQEQVFINQLDRVLRRGGVALIPAFAVGRSQEVLGLVAHHARQNPDLAYRVYLDGLTRAITACYDRFAEELTGQYRELRHWIDYRLVPVADRVDRDALIREEILGRPGVIIASSGMLKKGSLSYQYALHIAGDPKNAIFYSGYLAEDSEAVDFLQGTVDDLASAGIEVRCEQRRFYFSAHAPKEDLLQFVFDVRPRAVILIHGDADKRTQVPDNLFTLLKQMESDSFQVFIGQENHPIKYREGKFYQE